MIEFHLLKVGVSTHGLGLVCKLIEKNYHAGARLYIRVDTLQSAEQLDRILWTYKDDAFIPHQIYGADATNVPIHIGWGEVPTGTHDVLVNMAKDVPPNFSAFKRIIEIVFGDAALEEQARERYRYYRKQGCDIKTYNITPHG